MDLGRKMLARSGHSRCTAAIGLRHVTTPIESYIFFVRLWKGLRTGATIFSRSYDFFGSGPTLPTCSVQQVSSYSGQTGRGAERSRQGSRSGTNCVRQSYAAGSVSKSRP
jgi:hypothetical protein